MSENKNINKIIELVTKQWALDDLHGLPHWQRVERKAMLLVTADVNPRVVRLFAYLHDTCRLDNDSDPLHGFRAKCLVDSLRTSLLKELSNEEFHQLKTACELHTTTLSVGDHTIDTCFDADRLDLERYGILPDPQRMATAQGKYFAHNLEIFHSLTRQ